MQYGVDPRNLKNFIYISIELDNKIFLQFVEKWGTKPKYNRISFAY